jgi:hypothetical protein
MKRRHVGLGLLFLLAQACGDSTSSPVPSRMVITPSSTTMASLGETLQYSARLEDKKGKEITGIAFTWSTSDTGIATISSSGLATALKAGAVAVRASAEGITGTGSLTVNPIPDQVTKIAGDEQVGALRQVLPDPLSVEVQDANGNPVEGLFVTFSVVAGGGTATPWQAQTGPDGRASTVWQLGCSNDNPQRLDAKIGGLSASFTANVDLTALAICKESVPDGRETQAYSTAMEAAGGDQTTLNWSIVGGALPPGLTLQPSGALSGTPTLAGSFQFEAQVQDGQGAFASSPYQLRICGAPILLASGESLAFSPSGPEGCGFFLPAGADGDRYRFGVVYTRSAPDSLDVPTVTVNMKREIGGALSSEQLLKAPAGGAETPALGPRIGPQASAAFQEAMRLSASNQAFQYRLRMAEQELIRSLGPNARPLPDQRDLTRVSGPALASPDKVSFTNAAEEFTSCAVEETVRAIKVKEDDLMVIYQDSIQRASDALSNTHAQWMLDHYAAYGKQVIDAYFGGISDINDDGKIVVFVSPAVGEGVAAFVWSGDFFPKTAQPGWGPCPASNEMEMMRFNLSVIERMAGGGGGSDFQALGTVVHETKHISSLYKSIFREDYQPLWVEEGTAEFAEEVAARIGWAAAGGPPVGAMADSSDVNAFTRENYSVILVNAGTTAYLSSQPNGVVVTPVGASDGHSIYGSGWHFHRWLGDAYGDAATPLADAPLFRTLNDSLTAAGVQGILDVTGAGSWADLLEEYLTAVMLNGTDAPQGPRSFTSYDFPAMNTTFSYTGKPPGDYPWPVNVFGVDSSAPFATTSNTGSIGPSGVRIFDLSSNGSGLGLEVKVTTPTAASPFRIVLVRVE